MAAPGRAGRDEAFEVIGLGVAATQAYGRPDLAQRLDAARERLLEPAFRVVVAGEFKQGKSSLVNALVGRSVCAVDDDVATSVPTLVGFGEERAWIVRENGDGPAREEVALEDAVELAAESRNPDNREHLRCVEIAVPAGVLADGLVLVDTPGAGGLGSVHTATTVGALPMASSVVFVTDASQELTEPELGFLRTAASLCPNLLCVLTKIDAYPEWRRVAELDGKHLSDAGIRVDLLPVSATLHDLALERDDPELDGLSRVPVVAAYLRDDLRDAERLRVRAAAVDVLWIVDQLELQFTGERAVLRDPARAAALVAGLQRAKEETDRLRSGAAKWQQTLADGIADLTADLDHDLRARTREVLREAEEAIDESDPTEMWDEFEQWLYRRTNEEVVRVYAMVHERGDDLGRRVGEHFQLEHGSVGLALERGGAMDALRAVRTDATAELDRMTVGQQTMSAVRGAYGGILMFGMLAGMVGAAAVSPVILGIGAFMGRKQLRDERERHLAGQRAQAKAAVRRYVDEVSFNVTKDSRDTLRIVQRQLRDHFAAQAEELHRSTGQALQTAQQAVVADEDERSRRLRDVDAELQRIDALRRRARSLDPSLAAAK